MRWPADGRGQALAVLSAIFEDRIALDIALQQTAGLDALAPRDRAFARLLVMTVLRRAPQLDRLVDALMAKPLPAKQMRVRNVLRLGAAQLVFLETPAHAAVDGTVGLARAVGMDGMRGLINAVLRKLSRGDPSSQKTMTQAGENAPGWLWRSWCAAYGENVAAAIAEAHLAEPPLDITVKPGGEPEPLATELDAILLPTGGLRRRGGGAVTELAGYDRGDWWIQDTAASLPARLLGDVGGKTVVDLCAAPGGKTAQLCAAGAHVTAVDLSPDRLRTVATNLQRLGLAADLVAADATQWRPAAAADCVLLDAPCTATGTLRRHPDIAWLRVPSDVTGATATQDRLLTAAFDMLKPGGVLVYAVCSLQPEEGEGRIEALLKTGVGVRREPITANDLPGLAGLTPAAITTNGDMRTLPSHLSEQGGMDGFFAARLRRA